MDFRDETGSRFALEEQVLRTISQWSDTEFTDIALRLRQFMRDCMLPETKKELITKESVLIKFDISNEQTVFPCQPLITAVEDAVSRRVVADVVIAMREGVSKICLHGGAGVGKTTALQEIGRLLPDGSEMIVFDCYGAGSYMDASRLRHRPQHGFVQLANEAMQRIGLPALLVPRVGQDFARAFRQRLELAAQALASAHPEGLLVIAIDAADNSIAAASARGLPDTSFVTELMSIGDFPINVRVIVSARTSRLNELNAPSEYRNFALQAFEPKETAEHVARYWDARSEWLEDFHSLSNGNPRVQKIAFDLANGDWSNAINYLMPSGKLLGDIFGDLFQEACSKAGRPELIELMCAGLTVLPRPIPAVELARIIGISESEVLDICTDLALGVRTDDGFLSFTNEDFEAYVRERGELYKQKVQTKSADRLLANADTDEYAAMNVAHQLYAAGRRMNCWNWSNGTQSRKLR